MLFNPCLRYLPPLQQCVADCSTRTVGPLELIRHLPANTRRLSDMRVKGVSNIVCLRVPSHRSVKTKCQ
jgi:hypothetical protein